MPRLSDTLGFECFETVGEQVNECRGNLGKIRAMSRPIRKQDPALVVHTMTPEPKYFAKLQRPVSHYPSQTGVEWLT